MAGAMTNLKERLKKLESKVRAVMKPVKILQHDEALTEAEARAAMELEAAEAEAAGFHVVCITPVSWRFDFDTETKKWVGRA
jgi:hypothetical protein